MVLRSFLYLTSLGLAPAGGEQMFEALKTPKIDSELVVYPDEYHILHRPSFVRDRLERMVAWHDRYLSAK